MVQTPTQSVDFTDASVAPAWAAVDDRIMGGSSRSRVVHYPAKQRSEAEEIVAVLSDEGSPEGYTAFEGSLVQAGGGFASVRYGRPLSLEGVTALRLKVRVT